MIEELDLLKLFELLRKKYTKLVVVVLVFSIGTLGLKLFAVPDVYESEVILTSDVVLNLHSEFMIITPLVFPTDIAKNNSIVEGVFDEFQDQLEQNGISHGNFKSHLNVSQRGKDLWILSVETPDANLSANVANSWADILLAKLNKINVISEAEFAYLEKQLVWAFDSTQKNKENLYLGVKSFEGSFSEAKLRTDQELFSKLNSKIAEISGLINEIDNISAELVENNDQTLNDYQRLRLQAIEASYAAAKSLGEGGMIVSNTPPSNLSQAAELLELIKQDLAKTSDSLSLQMTGLENQIKDSSAKYDAYKLKFEEVSQLIVPTHALYYELLDVYSFLSHYIEENPPIFATLVEAEPNTQPSGMDPWVAAILAGIVGFILAVGYVLVVDWREVFVVRD
ncbi:MAG: hypothetical protein OEY93_03130 [Anaerolineae bacterium]|nr:hypothetical protein [Anaerolineae bacterium]